VLPEVPPPKKVVAWGRVADAPYKLERASYDRCGKAMALRSLPKHRDGFPCRERAEPAMHLCLFLAHTFAFPHLEDLLRHQRKYHELRCKKLSCTFTCGTALALGVHDEDHMRERVRRAEKNNLNLMGQLFAIEAERNSMREHVVEL
jgi:hypothetical protein